MIFKNRFTTWFPAFAGMTILASLSWGFQTELPEAPSREGQKLKSLERLEAGLATPDNVPLPIYYLSQGDYQKALSHMTPVVESEFPWLKGYLEGLVSVSADLVPFESNHFILFLPPDQVFLKAYAVPALEEAAEHVEKVMKHRPQQKIRVEIYPTKEAFSAASTLDEETLKRSGAIGICKFHRLMILTPRALPTGYRWMDALAHEYMHLIINELSWTQAELWMHEGTARYFDTSWRVDPPEYLSPNQKTKLLEAFEEDRLIEFKRMSPSLVYLKDQNEVSLAFSQVSHAIDTLIKERGAKKFVKFLKSMRKKPFKLAFPDNYGLSPLQFEKHWQTGLGKENWEKTRGALSDDILFEGLDENSVIGANVKGKVRLGDRMRRKGLYEAALIEYQKALKEEPDNAVILLKTARTNLAQERPKAALPHLKKAVKSNPNYGTPHIELAKLVSPKEALPLLKTAIAINPFDPEIHRLLSEVYAKMGETSLSERERRIFQDLTSN